MVDADTEGDRLGTNNWWKPLLSHSHLVLVGLFHSETFAHCWLHGTKWTVGQQRFALIFLSAMICCLKCFFKQRCTQKCRPYPEGEVRLTCAVCCCSALSWPHPPAAGSCAGRACAAVVTHLATVHPTVTWLCAAHPPAAGPGRHTQVNHLRKSQFLTEL